jgi:uncharacterized protein (DUF433 family)
MAEALSSEPVPIILGADGVMRVAGSRVTLETMISAFSNGATAEQIAQQYPSLSLADVYQAIGYYLRHSPELQPYLERHRLDVSEARLSNESRWAPDGIRERLLARRARF